MKISAYLTVSDASDQIGELPRVINHIGIMLSIICLYIVMILMPVYLVFAQQVGRC